MSPVSAELAVRYSEENWYAKISAYGTLRQKKVSRALSDEKELPGYLLLNTEAAYTVSDQMLFYLTVENILDAYYVTRFTVNNFPGRGISIRSGVTLRFDF
jgi:outer membrane cobalamin receptor